MNSDDLKKPNDIVVNDVGVPSEHDFKVTEDDGTATPTVLDATPPSKTPVALVDQTNFLPTKQVIMVFMGLSVALACSFLDQTM